MPSLAPLALSLCLLSLLHSGVPQKCPQCPHLWFWGVVTGDHFLFRSSGTAQIHTCFWDFPAIESRDEGERWSLGRGRNSITICGRKGGRQNLGARARRASRRASVWTRAFTWVQTAWTPGAAVLVHRVVTLSVCTVTAVLYAAVSTPWGTRARSVHVQTCARTGRRTAHALRCALCSGPHRDAVECTLVCSSSACK